MINHNGDTLKRYVSFSIEGPYWETSSRVRTDSSAAASFCRPEELLSVANFLLFTRYFGLAYSSHKKRAFSSSDRFSFSPISAGTPAAWSFHKVRSVMRKSPEAY